MHDSLAPRVLAEEPLRGGQAWSRILRRGQSLRLIDLEGNAAVAALFYNADDKLERYNMPDTLKAQHTARLTRGHVLYSDMGRVLCAITEDSLGHHDTLTGHGTRDHLRARYGEGSYQELRNDRFRNSRDNFLVELGKHGLGLRDLVPNVNWFVRIATDPEGKIAFVPNHSPPGASVELRAELNTLVILSNTPHPLDPRPRYAPGPVSLVVSDTRSELQRRDVCRLSCPENMRGFALTDAYFD